MFRLQFFIMLIAGLLVAEEDYRELNKNSYDVTAVEYQQNNLKIQPEVKTENFLSYLPPDSLVLDLGCGPGRDAAYFVEKGHQVVGVDISPQMIEMAKEAVPQATFLVSDIESLDFPAESFNAVWASASLLHVPKKAMPDALAMVYRILKPGGIFYVSMKKGAGEEVIKDARFGGVEKFWNFVDEEELCDLLESQGFHLLEQNTHEKSTSYQTNPWISIICQKPQN